MCGCVASQTKWVCCSEGGKWVSVLAMVGAAVLLRLAPSPGRLVSDQRWRDTSASSVPGPCVCRDRWSHPSFCASVEAGHTDTPVSPSGGHHSACEDSFLALPQFLCLIFYFENLKSSPVFLWTPPSVSSGGEGPARCGQNCELSGVNVPHAGPVL